MGVSATQPGQKSCPGRDAQETSTLGDGRVLKAPFQLGLGSAGELDTRDGGVCEKTGQNADVHGIKSGTASA